MVTGWHLSSECQQVKIYGVWVNFKMRFVLFSNSNASYTHILSECDALKYLTPHSCTDLNAKCHLVHLLQWRDLYQHWTTIYLPGQSEDAWQEQPCRNGFCAASYSPLMLHNTQSFNIAGTRGEQLRLCEGPSRHPTSCGGEADAWWRASILRGITSSSSAGLPGAVIAVRERVCFLRVSVNLCS